MKQCLRCLIMFSIEKKLRSKWRVKLSNSMLNKTRCQGWTLNFECSRHAGEWPSKCTCPTSFHSTKSLRTLLPFLSNHFSDLLFLITSEIYFNTERPLRSATVNSKSVLVSLSSRSFFQFLLALSPLTSQSLTCSLKWLSYLRHIFIRFLSKYKFILNTPIANHTFLFLIL